MSLVWRVLSAWSRNLLLLHHDRIDDLDLKINNSVSELVHEEEEEEESAEQQCRVVLPIQI